MTDFFSSLRFKAFTVAFLSFATLFLLVILNTNKLLDVIAVENIHSNVRQTSETMNLAIAPYTSQEGLDTLNDYIKELISGGESGIVYLALVDEDGRIIIKTETTPDQLPEPTPEKDFLYHEVIHIEQPTLLYGNQIGMLRFGMTWKQLHDGIQSVNREIITLLSIGFLLMISLIFYLGYRIIKRLSVLISSSQKIGEGHYHVRAPSKGRDEIAQLATNFNQMAQAIEDHIADIETGRMRVEELNVSLEDRVKERTIELATTLEDLKKTQDELIQSEKLAGLGSIVAAVAHELNTPIGNALTVATSFAEKTREFEQDISQGLKRSTLNSFTENVHSAADLLERNLSKASELILSFKHVAIDQTSSKRRKFDLAITLHEVIATVRPTFKKTGHHLELDFEKGIEMDSFPGSIGQVVTNFINNSILHAFSVMTEGTMKLSFTKETESWVKLVFSDNGQGISSEYIKQIFDPFFTTQLGKGGSGLGLNIVHNMVTGLLGGTIDVDSKDGEGAVFTLMLPIMAPVVDADGVDTTF
ncbi:MAG: HAMP domain-containing protein [Gammaproteobacteria bacterium]|nr:HAMP domain-containing protein [Gammaproteobacteria bacterium]